VVSAVSDALGSTTTGVIDYHRLEPWRLTDENGAVSEVRYDPLGVVVATTSYGHVGEQAWGFDSLEALVARTPATLASALSKPSDYLQGAASYLWYDLDAWSRDGVPTTVLHLAAEQLRHDGAGGGTTDGRIQIDISYLDGLGRPLQGKVRVEAGPAIERDATGHVAIDPGGHPVLADSEPRWRVSGHVIYDAKQNPVRQYEPFFSPSPAYEGDDVLQHVGVSTLTSYDAIGRPISTTKHSTRVG